MQIPTATTHVDAPTRTDSRTPVKRKRDVNDKGDEVQAFVTTPLFTTNESLTFQPFKTILRAHLPLAWLYIAPSQPAYIFKARITFVSTWEYHNLVARVVPNGGLFAIERVEHETYVGYALHNFVTENIVHQACIGAAPPVTLKQISNCYENYDNGSDHKDAEVQTRRGSISKPCDLPMPQNRRGAAARMAIMTNNDAARVQPLELSTVTPQSAEDSKRSSSDAGISQPVVTTEQHSRSCSIMWSQPDARSSVTTFPALPRETSDLPITQDQLASTPSNDLDASAMRQQYLETLYLSKTSLAYFAKGPLSRARAKARGSFSQQSFNDLITFYHASILPQKKMDVKFKQSLEEAIRSLPADINGMPESSDILVRSKMKKGRHSKLGKDGLWPGEQDFIGRWWLARDITSAKPTKQNSEELRSMISQIRVREIELQIVLILEVLSLEAKVASAEKADTLRGLSQVKIESIEGGLEDEQPCSKSKKRTRNLEAEMAMLADRLSIWYSIGLEDSTTSNKDIGKDMQSIPNLKDRLKNFCRDVVIPYYSAKLPHQCKTLCKILGGPDLSPQRSRKIPDNDSKPIRVIPGMAIKPPGLEHRKRTLERVLSEDHGFRNGSPPILTRSATMPFAPGLQREPSEVSQRPTSRGGRHKSVSFSNREIDLVADAQATASKRRKMDLVAMQKRELDAAIEALKKPNRTIAGRALMDELEKRNTEKGVPSRLSGAGVQITATPRKGQKTLSMDRYDLPDLTERDDPAIPSSTTKPRGLDNVSSISRSSSMKRAVLSAIHNTPSRDSLPRLDFTSDTTINGWKSGSPSHLEEIVSGKSRLNVEAGLVLGTSPLRMFKSQKTVLMTPMNKSDIAMEQAFRDAPEIPEEAGKKMDRAMASNSGNAERSIYDRLGWNDDYDL